MAERIFVTVVSQKSESPSPDSTDIQQATTDVDATSDTKQDNNAYLMSKFAAYQITKKVIATVNYEADYYFGKYVELTEDYHTGVNVQNAKTVISTIGSVFGSAASVGFMGFKFGGPVGAVIGAVAGAGMSVISSYISAKNTYNDAIANIHENVYSNYFYGTRAGYADGSRGTEN